MQIPLRIATYAGAALIGLLGWNLAAHVFIGHTLNSPSAKAEGDYFKMEREAQAKYAGPGTPTAAAMSRYAGEQAKQMLAAAAPGKERTFTAAQIFIGFYLTNAKARIDYCRERQVDLSGFASAFANLHRLQYERAAALFEANGTSVDDTWSTVRAALMHGVDTDMGVIAGLGVPMAKACQEIARRPRYFADQLNFAKRQPEIQRALMGG